MHQMLTSALMTLILTLAFSLSPPNFEKNNTCLEAIIKNEFVQGDVTIAADNFDKVHIPPDVVVTVTKFSSQKLGQNVIIYMEEAFPLQNLDPKAKYLVATSNTSIITNLLEMAQQQGLHKFLIVQGEQTYYSINPHSHGRSKGCKYPRRIFEMRKKFTSQCRLKVGYVTSPPYVINIVRYQNPGIMVSMINLMADLTRMKADYQNSTHFDLEFLEEGTIGNLTEALHKGQIDIAIGHLLMNDTKTLPFDYGPVIYTDNLWLTAPKPKKLKSYKKLFVVFDIELWAKIFTALVVMVFIFYLFGLCENFDETTIFGTMINVVRVSLCGSVTQVPKWFSFRVLLIFYALFSLSVDTIYLGKLSQIFALSSYDIEVTSLPRVSAVQMNFVINWRAERLLIISWVYRNHPQKDTRLRITNHTQFHLLNHTALTKENGTIIFDSFLKTHPSELSIMDHFDVITVYLSLFVTYYFNKNMFFNEALTFWGQEIMERGLPIKWFNDVKRSNVRVSILPEEEEKLVVLKLAHFEESFRVLIGGYILAFAGLALEYFYLKLNRIGVVKKVQDAIVFLVMLLKPPKLQKH